MYPRWKEELENHRLSQLQGRNASTGSVSNYFIFDENECVAVLHIAVYTAYFLAFVKSYLIHSLECYFKLNQLDANG